MRSNAVSECSDVISARRVRGGTAPPPCRTYICIYVYVCMYTYVCICICIRAFNNSGSGQLSDGADWDEVPLGIAEVSMC